MNYKKYDKYLYPLLTTFFHEYPNSEYVRLFQPIKNMLLQYGLIGPKVVKIRHSALNSENIRNLAFFFYQFTLWPLNFKKQWRNHRFWIQASGFDLMSPLFNRKLAYSSALCRLTATQQNVEWLRLWSNHFRVHNHK